MLVLSRKENQKIRLGEEITITVVRLKSNVVQIGIEAPFDVRVLRSELLDRDLDQSPSKPSLDGPHKEREKSEREKSSAWKSRPRRPIERSIEKPSWQK